MLDEYIKSVPSADPPTPTTNAQPPTFPPTTRAMSRGLCCNMSTLQSLTAKLTFWWRTRRIDTLVKKYVKKLYDKILFTLVSKRKKDDRWVAIPMVLLLLLYFCHWLCVQYGAQSWRETITRYLEEILSWHRWELSSWAHGVRC